MAIDYTQRYPDQTDTDANYPQGKARNKSTPAATDGFPFEEDYINDQLGFFQALLKESGITPSGNADNANSSDYLSALKAIQNNTLILKVFQTPTDNLTKVETFSGDAGVLFEVRRNSDNALASLYLDEDGNSPLSQNGNNNRSDSDGKCTFYIVDGEYYITINFESAMFSVGTVNIKKSISFIFDDAYDTAETVVKPLFDSYGKSFGIAIPYASLPNPNRLGLGGVKRLYSAGVEVLNHGSSGDVMNTLSKGVGGVKGELATCWSGLSAIGVNYTGFQTPSSILNASYLDSVKGFSKYAFTEATSTTPISENQDVHKLHRFSIEAASSEECVAAVEGLIKSDGAAIVFYAHNIENGDSNYLKLVDTLNYAQENGVEILTPTQCINTSVSSITNNEKVFYEGELLVNDPSTLKVNGGGTTAINQTSKDLTITLPSGGEYLVQGTFNFDSLYKDIESLVNFSALIRDLDGNISNCRLGLKMYDDINATGVEISSAIEEDINLNNTYVRYFQDLVKGTAKSVLFYIRLSATAATDVLIREPVVRFGSSIQGVRFFEPSEDADTGYGVNSLVIPSQTITAGAGYQDVTPPTEDNELYSNTGNSIVFKRDATVQFSASLVASGTNIGVGWKGGSVLISNGISNLNLSPVSGGDDSLIGISTLTLKVESGTALTIKALCHGIDFPIGTSSRLVVSEI